MKTIRIFIASPGDVTEERDRARQVVEQLRRRYAGQFDLKAVLWEDLPLQADMSFQQGIDLVLSGERGVDIAVFILWSRLGLPTGAFIRKPDGSTYRSGTERELDLMMAARQANQRRDPASDAPKILIYTRRDEASFDERLRGKPTDEKNQLLAQKKLVETFIQEEFHDTASGANARAYHAFDQPVTFSQRLRMHLHEILDTLAGGLAGEPVWDIAKLGSPFRGLEAFEFRHNPVFFGREDEVLEVRRALQMKAQKGCAFVLISGASGSGKSSLARAGVVPAVVEHEVDSTVSGWRYAVCAPFLFAGDLCGGLARLLCTEGVLPELSEGLSVEDRGEGLADAPKITVTQSVRPALVRASQGKPGATRLLLLVDQLEELFTDKRLTDSDRNLFVEVLEALARSGAVWVLAAVRSDFYQQCQRLPALMRMKEGPGQIDLLPPTADALRRLIEQPARLAGLSFEERDGQSLAGRILTDATAHAELLPLVSYVLRELFEHRTAVGGLIFAAYEQLGGVEGALAKRAEAVLSSLPHAAQSELPAVLRTLVSVIGDEVESVVRQRVPLNAFPPDSPARALVDCFVAERFLVTEKGAEGEGTVAVAHEALLRVWSRAAQWIRDNREFLRVRARVAARMKEGSRLLESDPLLEAARQQLVSIPSGFTQEQRAFIEDCAQTVQQARRRRERTRQYVIAGLSVLLLVAVGMAGWALVKRREASEARERAVSAERNAVAQRKEAERQARIARQTTELLSKMFTRLDPDIAKLRDITVREILDNTGQDIATAFPGEPLSELRVRLTLAMSYWKLDRAKLALPHAEAALRLAKTAHGEQDHPDVAESLNNVAACLKGLGRPDEALPKYEAALAMRQRIFQGDHPDVAEGLGNLALCLDDLGKSSEALAMLGDALAMLQRIYKGDHPDVALGLNNIAFCLNGQGRLSEALPKFKAALEMRQRIFKGDHRDVDASLNNLAACLDNLGRTAEALPQYEASLAMKRRLHEGDHADVALGLNNVAFCLRGLGRLAEALAHFEAALAMRQRIYSGDHPAVFESLNNVAICLDDLGRLAEALPKYEAASAMLKRLYKGDHSNVALGLSRNHAVRLRISG
jgi:tetratricopeptide (TPR) repeat protein